MEDLIAKLTKAMNDLQKAFRTHDYWTFIVAFILAGLSIVIALLPLVLLELPLTMFYTIGYFAGIISLFVINKLIKDNQKQIYFGVIRALLSCILPLPLIFLALSLWVKMLGVAFAIISFIIFYLVFAPVKQLLAIQRQMTAKT